MLKSGHFDSNIGIKRREAHLQLFYISTGYFHYSTGNRQSQIRYYNQPMRRREQPNQLFELASPVIC